LAEMKRVTAEIANREPPRRSDQQCRGPVRHSTPHGR
jgi:hypothetical protein